MSSDDTPQPRSSALRGGVTWRQFLVGYSNFLIVGTTLNVLGMRVAGFSLARAAALVLAATCGAALLDRPRGSFLFLRNVGWYRAIESDQRVRRIIAVVALVCLLIAVLARH
jgi:hypothetical protein